MKEIFRIRYIIYMTVFILGILSSLFIFPPSHMDKATTRMNEPDWVFLLEKIGKQKCVLFLGPEAFPAGDGQTLEQQLFHWLLNDKDTSRFLRKFYPDDGFFLFEDEKYKPRFLTKYRAFFQQDFSSVQTVLTKIAAIPFHFIITLTPDNLLAETYIRAQFDCRRDFYYKHRPANPFVQPTRDKPLIYNMLGNIEEDESMVLTHDDLFDYLESIFLARSMSLEMKTELAAAQSYLFVGVQFERWYTQLLLRILSLHSNRLNRLDRTALIGFNNKNLQQLYEEQFKIEFCTGNTVSFFNELYNRCAAEGLLKKPAVSSKIDPKSEVERVRQLIGAGDLPAAMDALENVASLWMPQTRELLDDLTLVRGNYRRIERAMILGLADMDAPNQQQRCFNAVLQLANQFEKLPL
ncbi:MAG: hypothetical protein DYG98_05675 [Haliscomenobacteraceae bacterium CHB4]|nr:hypothetical protein [Haliscomenobacteraceae bacterium CHB4]